MALIPLNCWLGDGIHLIASNNHEPPLSELRFMGQADSMSLYSEDN